MSGRFGGLDPAQQAWADERLPDAELIRDMSWGLVDTTVFHVRADGDDFVLKAAGPEDTHLPHEIAAHPVHTAPLVATGQAAVLRDASASLRIVLLDYLPGHLVLGTHAEWAPDTYAQAGELLRRLHVQESRTDADYEARATARALYWLDQPHRVEPDAASRARAVLQAAPAPVVTLVPTHGDWHPRNWLSDRGIVRVIDFGRFAFRRHPLISPASPLSNGVSVLIWRPPSSTATGTTRVIRSCGDSKRCARRSALPAGHTRSATRPSRRRVTGCWPRCCARIERPRTTNATHQILYLYQ